MQILSVELQLIVISELCAIDIVRLQRTCKHFQKLIKEFGHEIWKGCLQRLCFEYRLFWPTYKDLTEANELKFAATSPTRFYSAYRDALRRDTDLASMRTIVNVASEIPLEDLDSLLLVPGGRFIAALQKGRFSIWDLERDVGTNGQVPRLCEVFSLETDLQEGDELMKIRVISATTIRILACRYDFVGEARAMCQVFDIHWLGSENRFTGAISHRLAFFDDGLRAVYHSQLLDEVAIFHFDDETTVYWDYAHDKWISWSVQDDSEREFTVLGVFSNHAHTRVFYATGEGVSGVVVPPLQPVVNGGLTSAPLPSVGLIGISSWAHRELPNCHGGFVSPEFLSPRASANSPVITWQVREETYDAPVRSRTFRFIFDEETPEKSTLEALDCLPIQHRDGKFDGIVSDHDFLCEGKLITLWSDSDPDTNFSQHFVTIAPAPSNSGTPSSSSPLDKAVPELFSGFLVAQRGNMQSLSVELQLLVIAELRAIDIIRLQQTCKQLYDLVEEFSHGIWKGCLQRLCFEYRLFWPTYKDLTEASEFKIAATSSARLYNAYRKAFCQSTDLPSTRTIVDFASAFSLEDLSSLMLVPGGRFIVVLQAGRLSVWDLQRAGATNGRAPRLCEVFNLEIDPQEVNGLMGVRVISRTTIRVLAHRCDLDESLSDGKTLCEVFDIHWVESESRFAGTISHQLAFFDNEMATLYTYEFLDDSAILHYENGTTVFWDIAHDKWTSWKLQEDDELTVLGVFSNRGQNRVFYATAQGVSGVVIPPLQPVVNKGLTSAPLPSVALISVSSWAHMDPPICHGDFVSPDILSQWVCGNSPATVWQIREETFTLDAPVQSHTFDFIFDEETPPNSKLKESNCHFLRPSGGEYASLVSEHDFFCERFVTITPPPSSQNHPLWPSSATLPLGQKRAARRRP
ncbi:hypothetical protein NMY22_g13011 [Coprinellus aureogranulatus]|nr:hypothetical protein NMY22_g13011 [Coprinellus aureogranulatus]